jgi:hypothetical protein
MRTQRAILMRTVGAQVTPCLGSSAGSAFTIHGVTGRPWLRSCWQRRRVRGKQHWRRCSSGWTILPLLGTAVPRRLQQVRGTRARAEVGAAHSVWRAGQHRWLCQGPALQVHTMQRAGQRASIPGQNAVFDISIQQCRVQVQPLAFYKKSPLCRLGVPPLRPG